MNYRFLSTVFDRNCFKRGDALFGSMISSHAQLEGQRSTNQANIAMNRATNESNREIAKQTNLANRANVQATNTANIQMNEQNNRLQMQLQKEMNEYNSIGAQLERAREAGVNPNAIIGGSVSGNLQTTLPSTSAGHADAPIEQIGATMIPPQIENPMSGVMDAFKGYLESMKIREDTELTKEDILNKKIVNEYQNLLFDAGLDVSKATARQLTASAQLVSEQVNSVRKSVEKMNAEIALLDKQTIAQNTDNYYKSDMYVNHINLLKSQCNYNDAQAKYAIGVLPSVTGMNSAIAANQKAQAVVAKAQEELTKSEKARVDKDMEGLSIRNGLDAINFMIANDKDVIDAEKTNRKLNPRQRREEIKDLEYKNSTTNRVIQGFRDVSVGVGAAVVAGAQAKKSFGKKSSPVSSSPGQTSYISPNEVGPTYW